MNIFINSIKGLGINNVRPQKTDRAKGESNSVRDTRRRSRRTDEPSFRDSGPAVRLDISSGGRDIHQRIRRAYDLGPGWRSKDDPKSSSTQSMAPSLENLNFQAGQRVTVVGPKHLLGQTLTVTQFIPGRQGPSVVICADEGGVLMAFTPGELRILG